MRLSSVYSNILFKGLNSLFSLGFQNQIKQDFLYLSLIIVMSELKLTGNLMIAFPLFIILIEGHHHDIFDH